MIELIRQSFGVRVTVSSLEEARALPLKALIYHHKLLVIEGLINVTPDEIYELHRLIGTPWTAAEYDRSFERHVTTDKGNVYTIYDNLTIQKDHSVRTDHGAKAESSNFNDDSLGWHNDIPIFKEIEHPIRSLYPLEMIPGSGATTFCDPSYQLTDELIELLRRTEFIYQYWYSPSLPDRYCLPALRTHPVTKQASVMINAFSADDREKSPYSVYDPRWAWIIGTLVDGKPVDSTLINSLFKRALVAENIYDHHWKRGDMVFFDNFSGLIHGKRKTINPEGKIRSFIRINLKHDWQL